MRGRRRERPSPHQFYGEALTEAERLRLPRARRMQGLEEEIALLRLRLLRLLREKPENMDLLLTGVSLLVRAVTAHYRLSPRAADDLSQSIHRVLEQVGGALGLGERGGR